MEFTAMTRYALNAILLLLVCSAPVLAEDINEIFTKVNEQVTKKNYAKALEELGWARKELEKLHRERVQSFFPNQLGDFTGGKFEANSALGFTNIERTYSKGENTLRLSLSGESGGGQGLGGLAALGKMAAMFGQQSGQESLRIAGRTATLSQQEGSDSAELMIFLESGSMLKLEQSSGAQGSALKALAEKIDLAGLDGYLKG